MKNKTYREFLQEISEPILLNKSDEQVLDLLRANADKVEELELIEKYGNRFAMSVGDPMLGSINDKEVTCPLRLGVYYEHSAGEPWLMMGTVRHPDILAALDIPQFIEFKLPDDLVTINMPDFPAMYDENMEIVPEPMLKKEALERLEDYYKGEIERILGKGPKK